MNKKIDKKVKETKPVNTLLTAAIGGLTEMLNKVSETVNVLFGKQAKSNALKRVQAYVRPGEREDYERWIEVADGLKKHIGYADLKAIERQRASGSIRYLRQIVGVNARPTAPRVNKKIKPEIRAVTLDDLAEKNTRVILPKSGKTQNERIALVKQVLTALDNAFGTSRHDTLELILIATADQSGVKKQKVA